MSGVPAIPLFSQKPYIYSRNRDGKLIPKYVGCNNCQRLRAPLPNCCTDCHAKRFLLR